MEGRSKKRRNRAAIVVLGDIGRSPRMQYHALSLANQAGLDVDVVAYAGSEPHAALINHPRIQLHLMRSPLPQQLPRALYLLALPVKVITQIFMLLWILCVRIPAPDLFLVQNPPSIPALSVVRWVSRVRKAAFIIDWHNFGYTILGLSLGATHPLVKLYLWYERRYGRMADGYLCVTKAMQHELAQNWGIQATVLYDRSPDFFHATSVEEKHELYGRLQDSITNPLGIEDCCSGAKLGDEGRVTSSQVAGGRPRAELTLFTECQMNGSVCLREDRPAVVISSTSWTADEDFGILLEAAVCYDRRVGALLGELDSSSNETLPLSTNQSLYPRLLIIVTGKGPMREEYERRIRRLRLRRVAFRTMWVAAEDYPLLLGSADLGVCLHTSSSGLDLPMKVVDMFGCGLPVCAVSYSCIEELVKNHINGLLFSSSLELADQFLDLFKGFPHDCPLLNELREGALNCGSSSRWADEWECQVLPIISKVTCP